MNADETKAAAAVMIAFADGKKIECKRNGVGAWHDYIEPAWNWNSFDYRIAPEPMEVEVWVHEDGRKMIRTPEHWEEECFKQGFTLRRATIHPEEVKP